MQIQPVDTLIKEGFAQQVMQQFRAPAHFVASPDKLRQLQVLLKNATPEYPYIFLNVQSWAAAQDRYVTNRLCRQGIPVTDNSDGNQVHLARLVPTNFYIEVTFITNKYSGGLESVEGFARRWLFVRRNGAVNFTINYGLTNIPVTYTVAETLPLPPRESPSEQEAVYQVVGNITLQGFVSEPALGTRGRISQIILSEAVPTIGKPGEKFFPF